MSRPRDRFPTDWQLSVRMLVTMLLLAAVYLLFAVVLWQAGAGATTVALFLAAMLLLQYTFSDRLVLWSMGAQLVDERQAPELHAAVARLAALAGLPRPRVAIVPTPLPNAFATGRDPRHAVVAVTTGLLQRLEPDELEAVLAHEVTHIRNRDVALITFASFFATLASYIVQNWFFLGYGMGRGRDERGQNSAALVYFVSLLVWVVSFFLIRALSRYREYAADRGAAFLTGAPSRLASALLKISGAMDRVPQQDLREAEAFNAFFIMPAVSRNSIFELFSTHPSLEKRLAYLRRLEQEIRR